MIDSNFPILVSFYTDTWQYRTYSDALKADATRLGLSHHIVEQESDKFWFKNTRIKPIFLLNAFRELQHPMLWIDVDGSLYKKPDEFALPITYDLMMRRKPANHNRKWHVGTMFLNNTQNVENFLCRWVEYLDIYPNASDELCLDYMRRKGELDFLNIAENIPSSYFVMNKENRPSSSTVILHRESGGSDKKLR